MKFATHNDKPHPVHEKQKLVKQSIISEKSKTVNKSKINKIKTKNLPKSTMVDNGYSINDRLDAEKDGLKDADRRFQITISKISEITKKVHELEEQRNKALRKQHLGDLIKREPNNKHLQKEYDSINADNRDIQVYEEVVNGYRNMSNRKNELEEERNHYVKNIEELEAIKDGRKQFASR